MALSYGGVIMLFGTAAVFLFAGPLMAVFTADSAVIAIGRSYLKISAFILYAYVVLSVNIAALQGIRKPMFALWIGLWRQIVAPGGGVLVSHAPARVRAHGHLVGNLRDHMVGGCSGLALRPARTEKSRTGIDMSTPLYRSAAARRTALIDIGKFFLRRASPSGSSRWERRGLGYHWQWYRVPRFLFTLQGGVWTAGPLLQGLLVTLEISVLSLLCTLVLGLTTALFRLSASFTARALARGYLELIRNTPLLIQIFFVYFVLSPVLDIGAFASAVLALSLFEGAYAAEILRAGIVSLHQGQWEAAHSLGLGIFDTYRYVILPQAVRRVLPPLAGQAISLVKDSVAGQHHRHLRPHHAGAEDRGGDLSGFRDLVHRGGHLPRPDLRPVARRPG